MRNKIKHFFKGCSSFGVDAGIEPNGSTRLLCGICGNRGLRSVETWQSSSWLEYGGDLVTIQYYTEEWKSYPFNQTICYRQVLK